MADKTNIALAGNPNCGKTTLFNELTGSNGYVGNWPGVTVEKKQASWRADRGVTFVDLPGIYSLSPYSPEEVVSRDYLVNDRPDAVIDLVDVTNLERNLYLTTQLLEAGRPVVVGLNMCDLLASRGTTIDVAKLSRMLGAPVVEVSALRGTNLDALVSAAVEAGRSGAVPAGCPCFSPEVEEALGRIASIISGSCDEATRRWFSVKVFERDADVVGRLGLSQPALAEIEGVVSAVEAARDDDAESIVTSDRYDWIAGVMDACVRKAPKGLTVSQRIDKVVTNRVLGLPIFVVVMGFVYWLSISTVGTMATDWVNDVLFGSDAAFAIPNVVGGWLAAAGASEVVSALVLDGIVAGVGAILGFVPQMVVVFVLLSFLEDCGYMSRVAFVMDRLFRRFGLSGKSFIPMLVSTGCGVPGVLATKTIENERDRRMTTMLTTMIPCGAKLPIIALVMGVLAGGSDMWWVAPMFYFMGVVAIIVSAIMLKKTKPFAGEPAPFVMELPDYHFPAIKAWALHVWERVWAYIRKAGTIIFGSSVLVWFLSNFGVAGWEGAAGTFGYLPAMAGAPDTYMDWSLLAGLGSVLSFLFAPLGFGNWQAVGSTVSALIAKENLVSTFAVLYGLGEAAEGPALYEGFAGMFTVAGTLHVGAMCAFVAFNMLCAPCFAAIGTIRSQMNSGKWFWFAIGYECVFAWVVALMINQFYELVVFGSFGVWTVVAIVLAALMLFQLFRPMPKREQAQERVLDSLSA